MRTIGVTEFGGPDALHEVDLPAPQVGPGQIRVRVRAAAVNPTDTALRAGWHRERTENLDPPFVPGMDVAGVVAEIAADADIDLQVGDEVMAIVVPHGAHGGYSAEVVLPAASVVRIPAGQSLEAAATLPMNGLTARCALDELALEPGRTLAVTGAAGTLGCYVVELAKAEGLRVVADAAPKDEELVRGSGADVLVARGDGVADRIRAEVPDGVDGLVDCAVLDDAVIGAVRDGGGIATVRGFAGEPERGVTYHPVLVVHYHQERAKLDQLRAQAEAGTLTLRVAATCPAEQAPEAHRLLEAGGTRGRAVLTF